MSCPTCGDRGRICCYCGKASCTGSESIPCPDCYGAKPVEGSVPHVTSQITFDEQSIEALLALRVTTLSETMRRLGADLIRHAEKIEREPEARQCNWYRGMSLKIEHVWTVK